MTKKSDLDAALAAWRALDESERRRMIATLSDASTRRVSSYSPPWGAMLALLRAAGEAETARCEVCDGRGDYTSRKGVIPCPKCKGRSPKAPRVFCSRDCDCVQCMVYGAPVYDEHLFRDGKCERCGVSK